jgi:hypothetical protein
MTVKELRYILANPVYKENAEIKIWKDGWEESQEIWCVNNDPNDYDILVIQIED